MQFQTSRSNARGRLSKPGELSLCLEYTHVCVYPCVLIPISTCTHGCVVFSVFLHLLHFIIFQVYSSVVLQAEELALAASLKGNGYFCAHTAS